MKNRIFPLSVLLICLIFAFGQFSLNAAPKRGTAPKAGSIDKGLMFGPAKKHFVITRETPEAVYEMIPQIENAELVIDYNGKFPPASLLQKIATLNTPVNLVLPLDYSSRHLRRLEVLRQYSVTYRVNAETLTDKVIGLAQQMGPRVKRFEIPYTDLTPAVAKKLKRIPRIELMVRIADGKTLCSKDIKNIKAFGNLPKEIFVPASYPAKGLKAFKSLKHTRILLEAKNGKPSIEQTKALNKLKKLEGGAWVRGLIKKEEAFSYMVIENLMVFQLEVKNWKMTPEFVKMMNSHGETF